MLFLGVWRDFVPGDRYQPHFFASCCPQAQAAGAAVIEQIQEDYPQALKNQLHDFLAKIEVSVCRA